MKELIIWNFAIPHFIMQFTELKIPAHIISRFHVAGIDYNQASAAERSLFAITPANRDNLLADAKRKGFKSLFALSTCNRSELYGFCQYDNDLTDLFFDHTNGTASIFARHGYVKKGMEALEYLFKVAAGLNSQITGDYEIAGQLKCAVAQSRKQQLIGPIMDRAINYALQASKAIKTNTQLSNGTVSVSYAVIEWLKKRKVDRKKSVLLIGAGSMGRNIVKNIKHYLAAGNITIINRTDETAKELARETGTTFEPFSQLQVEVEKASIIIVCTNAPSYILLPSFFKGGREQYILDISVPENVDPAIKDIPRVRLAGIDEVSQTMQVTFAKRNAVVPQANAIIDQHLEEFNEWLSVYRYASAINDMKGKLYELGNLPVYETEKFPVDILKNKVNKTVSILAMHLRVSKEKGCQYINAINDFLKTDNNK